MSRKRKHVPARAPTFNAPNIAENDAESRRRAYLDSVYAEMFEIAADALDSGDVVQIVEAAEEATRRTDAHATEIFRIAHAKRAAGIQLPQVACRSGCSICCGLTVALSPFEAIRLARFLTESLSEEELSDLRSRIRDYAKTKGSFPPRERVGVMRPCVFLRDHRCTVYSVRPVACRAHHSVDVSACERASESPTKLGVPHFLEVEEGVAPIWKALQDAVKSRGLNGPRLDLPLAVGAFLEGADTFDRWLKGEHVLTAAAMP